MPLIFAFLTGLVLTAVLVPVVGGIARRFHLCATPSSDRWHTGVVPNIGGVAMFIPRLPSRIAELKELGFRFQAGRRGDDYVYKLVARPDDLSRSGPMWS